MESSVVLSYRCNDKKMKVVLDKIKAAELPIRIEYRDSVMHFLYRDSLGFDKCDGITQMHLESIIKGLIGLYKGID